MPGFARRAFLPKTTWTRFKFMSKHHCCMCGQRPLTKNEIGLTKKLVDMEATSFYCMNCLADFLEVDEDFLLERIKEYKEQGCQLF